MNNTTTNKPLIVITGASSGFGASCAHHFHNLGHPLLLLARRAERLTALQLDNTLCVKLDVTDSSAFSKAVKQAELKYGPADCLINNAGVMLLGKIDTQDSQEWKKMLDTNVYGLLNGIQSVLTGMKERQHGTIINISSVAGRKTYPTHAAYSGTKFAVHAISESVRETVSTDNVRVTTIAPGAAETELLSHTTSDEIKSGYQSWKNDMGGVMNADDVARAVVYAYQQPQSVCIREIVLAATKQQA